VDIVLLSPYMQDRRPCMQDKRQGMTR